MSPPATRGLPAWLPQYLLCCAHRHLSEFAWLNGLVEGGQVSVLPAQIARRLLIAKQSVARARAEVVGSGTTPRLVPLYLWVPNLAADNGPENRTR